MVEEVVGEVWWEQVWVGQWVVGRWVPVWVDRWEVVEGVVVVEQLKLEVVVDQLVSKMELQWWQWEQMVIPPVKLCQTVPPASGLKVLPGPLLVVVVWVDPHRHRPCHQAQQQ